MVRTQCFHLPISKRKLLKNLLLVAKVVILKQISYSYLYLKIRRQEKAAHTNNHKRTDTRCCKCSYLLGFFCFFCDFIL